MSSSSPPPSSSTWSFVLNDTSPMYDYKPYADGFNTSHGWSLWYSESGFNTQPSNPGSGVSQHFTSLAGASVSLQFYGAGIELYGTTNSSYYVTLDGTLSNYTTSTGSTLFSQTDLTTGTHSITLTAQPSASNQTLGFQYAVIYNPLSSGQSPPSVTTFSNADTSVIQYQGSWQTGTDQNIVNGTFHYTTSTGASVGMEFMGEAVAVQGITNWGNMNYTITLDDTVSPTLNSSTFYFVPEATLFYQGGLDPGTVHMLNLTQTSFEATSDPLKLAFDYVTVYGYQAPISSNPSSTSPVGAGSYGTTSGVTANFGRIIAGSIAGAGVLGLAIFGFLRWRRRRLLRRARIEPSTEATPIDMGETRGASASIASGVPLVSAGAGRMENGRFDNAHGSSASGSSRSLRVSETPSRGYAAAMSDLGPEAGGVSEGAAIASSGVLTRFNSTRAQPPWQDGGDTGVSDEPRNPVNNEKPAPPSVRSVASSAAPASPATGPGRNQGPAGVARPLPPPPGTTPSPPPVQGQQVYQHQHQHSHSQDLVRSVVQEHVRQGQGQPGTGGTMVNQEVDRILEMIASRIDRPEGHSMPPPEYPRR